MLNIDVKEIWVATDHNDEDMDGSDDGDAEQADGENEEQEPERHHAKEDKEEKVSPDIAAQLAGMTANKKTRSTNGFEKYTGKLDTHPTAN